MTGRCKAIWRCRESGGVGTTLLSRYISRQYLSPRQNLDTGWYNFGRRFALQPARAQRSCRLCKGEGDGRDPYTVDAAGIQRTL